MAALQGKAVRFDPIAGKAIRSIGSDENVTIVARTWDAELLITVDADGTVQRVLLGSPATGNFIECKIATHAGRPIENVRAETALIDGRVYVPGVCEEDRTVTPLDEFQRRRRERAARLGASAGA